MTRPRSFLRVVSGEPDPARPVTAWQLKPDEHVRLGAWLSGDYAGIPLADGGLLLVRGSDVIGRLALGDFAVREGLAMSCEPADGFYQRFEPAGSDDA